MSVVYFSETKQNSQPQKKNGEKGPQLPGERDRASEELQTSRRKPTLRIFGVCIGQPHCLWASRTPSPPRSSTTPPMKLGCLGEGQNSWARGCRPCGTPGWPQVERRACGPDLWGGHGLRLAQTPKPGPPGLRGGNNRDPYIIHLNIAL